MKLNLVITGGLGFIGSHLVEAMAHMGHNILIIDDLSTGNFGNIQSFQKNCKIIKTDLAICDIEKTSKIINVAFKNIDYMFHFAALPRIQPSFEDPITHEKANVFATINALEIAKSLKVKKFIYSGSSSCYGNAEELPTTENCKIHPMNPYAIQKYTSELYVKMYDEIYDLPTVTLRYFNAYGERSYSVENSQSAYSSVIGIFAYRRSQGWPIQITGDGTQKRDFVHAADIARANFVAAISDQRNETFNIGCGKSFSVNKIAQDMSYTKADIEYIPERPGEATETLADISKAERLLKWKPTISLKEGIDRTVKYYLDEILTSGAIIDEKKKN